MGLPRIVESFAINHYVVFPHTKSSICFIVMQTYKELINIYQTSEGKLRWQLSSTFLNMLSILMHGPFKIMFVIIII